MANPVVTKCDRLHPVGSPGDARVPVRCLRRLGHGGYHYACIKRDGYRGQFKWTEKSYARRRPVHG